MNFWEIFTKLCRDNGESATSVLEGLGLSKGNANRWKNGGTPTLKTAIKIAAHFGVPLDNLATSGEDHPTTE